mmetsp:Transcript_32061/g.102115  ORF Transcript_32061/g.102115 Transcript_32061/m.102115 type:complete len:399 (+) Transcript_32061:3-1199(+)
MALRSASSLAAAAAAAASASLAAAIAASEIRLASSSASLMASSSSLMSLSASSARTWASAARARTSSAALRPSSSARSWASFSWAARRDVSSSSLRASSAARACLAPASSASRAACSAAATSAAWASRRSRSARFFWDSSSIVMSARLVGVPPSPSLRGLIPGLGEAFAAGRLVALFGVLGRTRTPGEGGTLRTLEGVVPRTERLSPVGGRTPSTMRIARATASRTGLLRSDLCLVSSSQQLDRRSLHTASPAASRDANEPEPASTPSISAAAARSFQEKSPASSCAAHPASGGVYICATAGPAAGTIATARPSRATVLAMDAGPTRHVVTRAQRSWSVRSAARRHMSRPSVLMPSPEVAPRVGTSALSTTRRRARAEPAASGSHVSVRDGANTAMTA